MVAWIVQLSVTSPMRHQSDSGIAAGRRSRPASHTIAASIGIWSRSTALAKPCGLTSVVTGARTASQSGG